MVSNIISNIIWNFVVTAHNKIQVRNRKSKQLNTTHTSNTYSDDICKAESGAEAVISCFRYMSVHT